MNISYAHQYHKPCITLATGGETADEVILAAKEEGATYAEYPGETCYVVEFPGRPQELYTEEALRRSLK